MDYKKNLTLQPGQHCQVHENKGPRNSDKDRTQGDICLGTYGNLQCGFKFMILQTVQKITKYNWDETTITKTVIDRFNVLGKYQPEHFIFTDRKGRKIGESDIIGVQGDQNVTPQILIEQDDDLDEQDVFDKDLAAQTTEYEDHLETHLNQYLTIEE